MVALIKINHPMKIMSRMTRYRYIYCNPVLKKILLLWLVITIPLVIVVQVFQTYDPVYDEHKMCYTHKISYMKSYSESVEFFEDMLTAYKQPTAGDSIFFVDSNCSASGLLDITAR